MDYYVYTDGACSKNGYKNAKAGYGIYFGEKDPRNVSHRLKGYQTNNTAELTALVQVYDIIKKDLDNNKIIGIVSDSKYAIGCCSHYGEKCAKMNWGANKKKSIPNIELVKQAYSIYNKLSNIKWIHVSAHTGNNDLHSLGNAGADRLANEAIGLSECPYHICSKIYLNVPFIKKDYAKKLGARWDPQKKKWYSFKNNQHIDALLSEFS